MCTAICVRVIDGRRNRGRGARRAQGYTEVSSRVNRPPSYSTTVLDCSPVSRVRVHVEHPSNLPVSQRPGVSPVHVPYPRDYTVVLYGFCACAAALYGSRSIRDRQSPLGMLRETVKFRGMATRRRDCFSVRFGKTQPKNPTRPSLRERHCCF
eukprot:6652518-Prymnesium_polylepis.1